MNENETTTTTAAAEETTVLRTAERVIYELSKCDGCGVYFDARARSAGRGEITVQQLRHYERRRVGAPSWPLRPQWQLACRPLRLR